MKTHLINRCQRAIIACLCFSFLISACQPEKAIVGSETPPVSPSPSPQPPTPSPTSTATPSSTATRPIRLAPTNTSAPEITPTVPWIGRNLSLTPLPPITQNISPETIPLIKPIALWGSGRANEIALSPDGLTLAVGTNIGAFFYSSINYQLLGILQTPFAVQSIAFSADNHWVALAQTGQTIDLYEREGYSLSARFNLSSLELPPEYQISVHFSPAVNHFVSVVKTDAEIYVNRWDLATQEAVASFSLDHEAVTFINPHLDLIGLISDSRLSLQSLSFADESDSLPLPRTLSPSFWAVFLGNQGEIVPSTDGTTLLIDHGASLTSWRITEESVAYQLDDYPENLPDTCYQAPETCRNIAGEFSWPCPDEPNRPAIGRIALTPDNLMILVSLNQGQTEFRRASDGELAWEIDATFTNIIFSPGSEFFFGVNPDGSIEKRSTLDGALLDVLDQHPNRLYDLAFAPDGDILAAGFDDGWIRVYSTQNGQMLGVLNGSAKSLQFSPDGRWLAAGLTDGSIRIFVLDESRYNELPGGHLAAVTDLAFSPDGQQLITGSRDCTVSLWDLQNRFRMQNLTPDPDHPARLSAVGFLANKNRQFFTADQRGLSIFTETQIEKVGLSASHGMQAFTLDPHRQLLAATGSQSYLIPVSPSIRNKSPRKLSTDPFSDGYALAFTPEESILVIATGQELVFWSQTRAEALGSLNLDPSLLAGSRPAALSISPDGRLIALGFENGLINLYGVP